VHDDEQQALDDIFAAQVDLSHGRRAAAMDHTELGETVLLNAQQARGYTAPTAPHALGSAQMSASLRARVPPDGGDPLGDKPKMLKVKMLEVK